MLDGWEIRIYNSYDKSLTNCNNPIQTSKQWKPLYTNYLKEGATLNIVDDD